MCNYMTVLSLHSGCENWVASFVPVFKWCFNSITVEFFADEDDNRGSGR
jgi:hypothetical protein